MIRLENLSFNYKNTSVFNNVSVTFQNGKISFVIGPNGSGKTTLIKLLADYLKATSGKIDFTTTNPQKKKIDCRFYFDSSNLINDFKALDHFKLIGYLISIPDNFIKERANVLIDIFKIPTHKKVRNMSQGQQCKLALAMNLLYTPKYMLLDEPFVYLDIESKVMLMHILTVLSKKTCLLVTTNDLTIIDLKFHFSYLIKNNSLVQLEDSNLTTNSETYMDFMSLTDNRIDFNQINLLIPWLIN